MKLGDVCDSVSVTFDKTKQQVVLINTSDVLEGEVTNHILVDNKGLKGQFKKTFQKNDILYSEIRPKNRRFAYIDFDSDNYVASTKLMVIRANNRVLPQYLYQVLKSEKVINQLQSLAESRSGTFPQITFSELAQIDVYIPELSEQKEIADFLKLFDDKIENNKKINHHLEQIGQELFEDLYFSGESALLGDAISVIESGSRPKGGAVENGIPSIGAENIERFGQYDYSKEKYISLEYFKKLKRGIVQSGDVLLYKDGAYTGKVSLALENFPHAQCAVNEHVFILRPSEFAPSSFFLYFLLLKEENRQALFSRASSKAAQPGLNQMEVKSLPIKLPRTEQTIDFNDTVKPIMQQISRNASEIRQLSLIRDNILPKLLSGEISANQATK